MWTFRIYSFLSSCQTSFSFWWLNIWLWSCIRLFPCSCWRFPFRRCFRRWLARTSSSCWSSPSPSSQWNLFHRLIKHRWSALQGLNIFFELIKLKLHSIKFEGLTAMMGIFLNLDNRSSIITINIKLFNSVINCIFHNFVWFSTATVDAEYPRFWELQPR